MPLVDENKTLQINFPYSKLNETSRVGIKMITSDYFGIMLNISC